MTTASETRPLVHGKNDIAISSRSTDFNVQISAFNIHSHCSQMFGQNYKFNLTLLLFFMNIILKNNLWSFKRMCFFVIKPMVEIISFQLK